MSLALKPLSVAIAGGGIIGMSLAWRLAQHGFKVAVFETGQVGGEASWAGAGMLAPGGEFDKASELATLAIDSRKLYPDFVRELKDVSGLAIDLRETGAIDLAYSSEEHNELQARAARQAAIGMESRPVDLDELRSFWPNLRAAGFSGAFFYRGDASVDPRQIMAALRLASEKLGVAVFKGCGVEAAEIGSGSVTLTVAGSLRESFDALVLAAGAWSGTIPLSGVPPQPATQPVRGHLIGYHQSPMASSTIIRHAQTYLLQRSNGFLIAGASVEHVGFDRSVDQSIVERLREQAAYLLPGLSEMVPSEVWNGFRPGSDTLHVGPWHSGRLFLAYGHYRNGILLAPLTAQRLAGQISASLQRH